MTSKGTSSWGRFTEDLLSKERKDVAILRNQVVSLREEVTQLETQVAQLGDSAQTWPEDLGDWNEAPPRMQGLVTRVIQTAKLAAQVETLAKAVTREEGVVVSAKPEEHRVNA